MARAGERDIPITLKKPILTVNAKEEQVRSFVTVGTCWAAIDWQSGRRFESAKQTNSEVQGVIRVAYRTDIRADWHITWGRRTVEILSLSNTRERNAEMVLWVKEALD